jgi:hypothetical protein
MFESKIRSIQTQNEGRNIKSAVLSSTTGKNALEAEEQKRDARKGKKTRRNTQVYWVFWTFSSYGILETRKH